MEALDTQTGTLRSPLQQSTLSAEQYVCPSLLVNYVVLLETSSSSPICSATIQE